MDFQRGLCNYYSSSEDEGKIANANANASANDGDGDNGAVKSNPKTISTKKRGSTPKSPVIRSGPKSRQSEEDRKNERLHRHASRDSTSR